jgi:uncharacterized damage-inducible protein DinB
MNVRDAALAEFDHEMAVTRRVLERTPEAAFAWKPHEKSYSLGALASHLARLPHWGTQILERDFYDMAAVQGGAPAKTTVAEVLAMFDGHVSEVRAALIARSDVELDKIWTLKRGGQTLMQMPKLTALRSFLVHHTIHHRGQMTVYLRLQGVPIPPIYGPTADETM